MPVGQSGLVGHGHDRGRSEGREGVGGGHEPPDTATGGLTDWLGGCTGADWAGVGVCCGADESRDGATGVAGTGTSPRCVFGVVVLPTAF